MENINWNAISAIGSWFGSVATFGAVVVALWQTKYANKKKAKLSFVDNLTITPAFPIGSLGYMPETQYVGVDFTNVGNRKIIIKNFWMELPDNHHTIIFPASTPIGTVSLPLELDIEESVFLPWEKEKFLEFLKHEESLPQDSTLTFCVTDSTGVTYKCKTKKFVGEYLNNGITKTN